MPSAGEQAGGGGGPYPGSNLGRSESESRAPHIFRRPVSPQPDPSHVDPTETWRLAIELASLRGETVLETLSRVGRRIGKSRRHAPHHLVGLEDLLDGVKPSREQS